MEESVRQAITTIRRHYDEPLHLDDLARIATMSKFHFLRTFRSRTGITPARYLSAVRIHAAKRLLLTTPLDVAQISCLVGYGSLGTFTTRFTECVGVSPIRYRRLTRGEPVPLAAAPAALPSPKPQAGLLTGTVHSARRTDSPIMLGLFPSRIPQGRPVACTTVDGPGSWQIRGVPPGNWHLLGVTLLDGAGPGTGAEDVPILVANPRVVRMPAGAHAQTDVYLRDVRWTDPPLLIALPGVDAAVGPIAA